ncbi:uncharacterized protein B0H18DRAFT_886791, partial [Fomitopsis serialis]|uniref:uncharacterized protein n=1 Tax=Fomitopsis serialis TaxID=139415 RepID=UPI0020081F80
ILVNPTGKPHAFRGVDWVVELMNLFTKDTYGGDGSNYTKDRVITESPNVLVYRSCARNAEHNFYLSGLSSAHGKKNLKLTFSALLKNMDETRPHERREGRKSAHCVRDMLSKGVGLMLGGTSDVDDADSTGLGPPQDGVDTTVDAADLSLDTAL